MTKRGDLPKTRAEAERMLRDASTALAALDEAESWEAQVYQTEPVNRSTIQFDGTFQPGGRTYSFVAIRADHYRGKRRWFISQNFAVGKAPTIPSPATWVEIVAFATAGTIHLTRPVQRLDPLAQITGRPIAYESEIMDSFFGRSDIDPTEGMSPGSYSYHDV